MRQPRQPHCPARAAAVASALELEAVAAAAAALAALAALAVAAPSGDEATLSQERSRQRAECRVGAAPHVEPPKAPEWSPLLLLPARAQSPLHLARHSPPSGGACG